MIVMCIIVVERILTFLCAGLRILLSTQRSTEELKKIKKSSPKPATEKARQQANSDKKPLQLLTKNKFERESKEIGVIYAVVTREVDQKKRVLISP